MTNPITITNQANLEQGQRVAMERETAFPTTPEAVAIEEARQQGESEGWALFEAFLDRCEGFLDTEGMACDSEETGDVIARFVEEARDDLHARRGGNLPTAEEVLERIKSSTSQAACSSCGDMFPVARLTELSHSGREICDRCMDGESHWISPDNCDPPQLWVWAGERDETAEPIRRVREPEASHIKELVGRREEIKEQLAEAMNQVRGAIASLRETSANEAECPSTPPLPREASPAEQETPADEPRIGSAADYDFEREAKAWKDDAPAYSSTLCPEIPPHIQYLRQLPAAKAGQDIKEAAADEIRRLREECDRYKNIILANAFPLTPDPDAVAALTAERGDGKQERTEG